MRLSPHHTLVVGCGSIGERHVRTFLATGRTAVTACDPAADARSRVAEKYGVNTDGRSNSLCTLEEGIQSLRFNLAALRSWRENRPVAP